MSQRKKGEGGLRGRGGGTQPFSLPPGLAGGGQGLRGNRSGGRLWGHLLQPAPLHRPNCKPGLPLAWFPIFLWEAHHLQTRSLLGGPASPGKASSWLPPRFSHFSETHLMFLPKSSPVLNSEVSEPGAPQPLAPRTQDQPVRPLFLSPLVFWTLLSGSAASESHSLFGPQEGKKPLETDLGVGRGAFIGALKGQRP